MSKQYIHFDELPLNSTFHLNGTTYKKRSSRTAAIVAPAEYAHKWFYFSVRTLCIVGLHSRLAN